MAYSVNFTGSYPLPIGGWTFPGYIALYTLILNLVVTVILTPVFNAISARGTVLDETVAADYHA